MPPIEFMAAAPMLPFMLAFMLALMLALMLATAAAESRTLELKVAAAWGETDDMPPTGMPMLFIV